MLKFIKKMKLWGWLSIVIAVLLGRINVQSRRLKKSKKDTRRVEDALVSSKYKHQANVKNKLNEEAYKQAKEELNNEVFTDVSKPYDA